MYRPSMILTTNSFKMTATKFSHVIRQISKKETNTSIQSILKEETNKMAWKLSHPIETHHNTVMRFSNCEVDKASVRNQARVETNRSKIGRGRTRPKPQEEKLLHQLKMTTLGNARSRLLMHLNRASLLIHQKGHDLRAKQKLNHRIKLNKVAWPRIWTWFHLTLSRIKTLPKLSKFVAIQIVIWTSRQMKNYQTSNK